MVVFNAVNLALVATLISTMVLRLTVADPACNIRALPVGPESLVRAGVGPFSYVDGSPTGPDKWGNIMCAGFYTCKTGKYQSPIDVQKVSTWTPNCKLNLQITPNRAAKMHYAPAPNDFMFRCEMPYEGCGRITYRGVAYDMLQMHLHSPSEHRINGQNYPMEIHLVHQNKLDASLAVLGIFIKEGAYNPEFSVLFDAALRRSFGIVDIQKLIGEVRTDPRPCTFTGSLTTPPCTEGIKWILSTNPITATRGQIELFRNMTGRVPNNRPLQNGLGRSIRCFTSGPASVNMPYCTNEHY